jgi:hypothetical protein
MEKQSKALEIKQQYVHMIFSAVWSRVEVHYDLYVPHFHAPHDDDDDDEVSHAITGSWCIAWQDHT